jgi:hypothetical protein
MACDSDYVRVNKLRLANIKIPISEKQIFFEIGEE